MAITYEFRNASAWIGKKNRREVESLLKWRIQLLSERLDVTSHIVLGPALDVKAMRKEKMRVGGTAPGITKVIIPFDHDRIDPDDVSWREEFLNSVDHEVFHNAQFQAAHRVNDFSFASDFITEGGATAYEIEMGSSVRPQLAVLRSREDWETASSYARKYWTGNLPYDRDSWLFGKQKAAHGKGHGTPKGPLHRARTGYNFSFAVFSGYCNLVQKLPSDLLFTRAKEIMDLWMAGKITPAMQGPDREMIKRLAKKRNYSSPHFG